jgi:predicted deacylase
MKKKISLLISMIFISGLVMAQTSYYFQNREIKSGTKQHFMVPIVTGHDSTFIPVSVFNGAKDGKTLGITAGVHGYEYAPIMGAQKLINSIDLEKLKGVVILVQLAGLDSFLGRSPYTSPVDGKNLNRSFPGSETGTNTEKVAKLSPKLITSWICIPEMLRRI